MLIELAIQTEVIQKPLEVESSSLSSTKIPRLTRMSGLQRSSPQVQPILPHKEKEKAAPWAWTTFAVQEGLCLPGKSLHLLQSMSPGKQETTPLKGWPQTIMSGDWIQAQIETLKIRYPETIHDQYWTRKINCGLKCHLINFNSL